MSRVTAQREPFIGRPSDEAPPCPPDPPPTGSPQGFLLEPKPRSGTATHGLPRGRGAARLQRRPLRPDALRRGRGTPDWRVAPGGFEPTSKDPKTPIL